jgi:IS5 family transposase
MMHCAADRSGEVRMAGQPGFFDRDRRYAALSAAGDPLERLALVIDVELFRAALARSGRAKGGRPPYDAVLMFKILVLQTLDTLSDDRRLAPRSDLGGRPGAPTGYQTRDRLSFMRFLGLALEDRVPDAKTIWLFREQLTHAGAIERLFARFDVVLRQAGYLAMAGQIVDATVVEARRPRLTQDEKATVKAGSGPAAWSKAKRAQMDTDGRWTLKRGRRRPPEGTSSRRTRTALVIPIFGYKNHLGIDRRHGFIRNFTVTDAATHDGGQLGRLLDPANTASPVWADAAIARRPTSGCWRGAGWCPGSSAPSRAGGRCRCPSPAATPRGRGFGSRSSLCSPPRSVGSA